MKLTRVVHAVFAAAFLATVPGLAILVDTPAATAQISAGKPDRPNKPHDDDCIPVGVTKYPNGAVYAEEDCDGIRSHTRMSQR